MLKFYFNGSPNPTKVALFLEEAGLAYEPIPVDTRKGQQFEPDYLQINPNGKVPAIVDGATTVFDSNAILLYLAEKTGKFLPMPTARAEMLSWLMFTATGVGPFCGQAIHFSRFATEKIPYAIERYEFEARRHFHVLDSRLAERRYLVGQSYTIVDMDVWGWARLIPFILGEDGWASFPHLKRLHDEIDERPAAARAKSLKDRFDFKTTWDSEARRHMFKHVAA
jgi:GST-like protein